MTAREYIVGLPVLVQLDTRTGHVVFTVDLDEASDARLLAESEVEGQESSWETHKADARRIFEAVKAETFTVRADR